MTHVGLHEWNSFFFSFFFVGNDDGNNVKDVSATDSVSSPMAHSQ